MRLIDADKVKEQVKLYFNKFARDGLKTEIIERAISDITEVVDDAPTVDAEPIRRGQWLEKEIYDGNNLYHIEGECSVCHNTLIYNSNYCPHCGALMDEVEE